MTATTGEGHQFAPHERPIIPGSPATPDHPPRRRIAYAAIGLLIVINGGLINGLLLANLPQIGGAFGLSSVQSSFLTVAYITTNVASGFCLLKFRQQFGIEPFVKIMLITFAVITFIQLFVRDFGFELFLRAVSGVVGSGLTGMGLLYIMQALPAKARLGAVIIGVGLAQIAVPFARVFSPWLYDLGGVQNIFLFEFGSTLLCIGAAALLPLPPGERINAIRPLDLLSALLYVIGFGLLAAVLTLGRVVWWPTEWIGQALFGAVIAIGTVVVIEYNRKHPLFEIRWIGTAPVIRFVIAAAIIRLLLSEQTFGATGLLSTVGLGSDELVGFYTVVVLASLAGLGASLATFNPQTILMPGIVTSALVAIAAFADSGANALTRPHELLLTQAMLAFAATFIIGPTMMSLLIKAFAQSQHHILSFSAVFGLSQQIGGALGAALLGTFQIARERFHSQVLVERIVATDPQVATRLTQYGFAQASEITDPVLRQAQGGATLSQQVSQQANIIAFNDVFLLIGAIAAVTFVCLLGRALYFRWQGHGPLDEDLKAMEKQMKGAAA